MSIKYIKTVGIALSAVALGGCGGQLSRLQNSMDLMTYHMGTMAANMPQIGHHAGRLANATERLEGKADRMVTDFQKKGATAERAVQNYTQTFIDNDKAIAKNLQGIKQEISELKQGQHTAGTRVEGPDQAKINASINDRISRLEAQIAALNSKLK